jgi:hypothetical protein
MLPGIATRSLELMTHCNDEFCLSGDDDVQADGRPVSALGGRNRLR